MVKAPTAPMPGQPDPAAPPALLDVEQVAALLNCSPRHVYRLADAGRMPAPVRLGALVRWSRLEIETWVSTGCKPCRPLGRR
jgi:excisionase family DNA binding protein